MKQKTMPERIDRHRQNGVDIKGIRSGMRSIVDFVARGSEAKPMFGGIGPGVPGSAGRWKMENGKLVKV